jgi:hypothetical protein
MTDTREEIEAKANSIVDNWRDLDDPVVALTALRKSAPKAMAGFFAMLGSELAMAMNESPTDDPQRD